MFHKIESFNLPEINGEHGTYFVLNSGPFTYTGQFILFPSTHEIAIRVRTYQHSQETGNEIFQFTSDTIYYGAQGAAEFYGTVELVTGRCLN